MIVDNVRHPVVDKILLRLSAAYNLAGKREGIHCTDAIYCLRKSFWNKVNPLPPSPIEAMHFLTGLGLQDTLLRYDTPPSILKDGIWVSADCFEDDELLELKTTMMGEKRLNEHDFPEGWIKQLKAYCHAYNKKSITLLVLPLMSKRILPYVLTFTGDEIEENWDWIWTRAQELKSCLDKIELPESKGFEWECKDCRFRLRCQVTEAEKGGKE